MSGGVWFTSDLHLGHAHVARLRGFDDTVPHDGAVLASWRDRVKPNDLVWVLGDLTLRNPKLIVPTIATLPGRKRLIAGNHDRCHPMHRDAHRWAVVYADAFEWVGVYARVRLDGRNVLLSHLPYNPDLQARPDDQRFGQYRLPDLGLPLLHGHTHSPLITTAGLPNQYHVGWDAWRRPVAAHEIVPLLPTIDPDPPTG